MTSGSTSWVGDEPKEGHPPARHRRIVGVRCYEQAMSIQCRDCLAGLEHCHGTVVHHVRYRAECTDDGCTTPEIAHTFSIDCESIGCPCCRDIALAI